MYHILRWSQSSGSIWNAGTLVIYLFGDSDPHYRRNFEFFLEHGLDSAEGEVDYVIVVQLVRSFLCE